MDQLGRGLELEFFHDLILVVFDGLAADRKLIVQSLQESVRLLVYDRVCDRELPARYGDEL